MLPLPPARRPVPGRGLGFPALAALALVATAARADPARLDGWSGRRSLEPEAQVLRLGSPAADGLGDPALLPDAAGFVPLRQLSRNQLPAPHWFRFELWNPSAAPLRRILVQEFPLTDHIEVAWRDPDGSWRRHPGGLAAPLAGRTLRHAGPLYALPLELAPGERRTVFLGIALRSSFLEAPALLEEGALEDHLASVLLLFGAGLGAMLLLLAANLAAFARSRERLFLQLGGLAGAAAVWLLATSGIGPRWLWPASPRLGLALPLAAAGVGAALALALARRLVGSAETWPGLDRALAVLSWCALGAGLAQPVARAWSPPALALSLGLGIAAAVMAGARSWRLGQRPDVAVAAAAVLALMGLPVVLGLAGLVRPPLATMGALHLAFALGAGAFTLAFADRAAAARQRSHSHLEAAVSRRTRELSETVERLRAEGEERRRAEEAHRESEELFRVAFETSPDAVLISRVSDGMVLAANPGSTLLSGWNSEEAVGKTTRELQLWADAADRERFAAAVRASGVVENAEFGFRLRDGTVIPALISARIIQVRGVPCILSVTRNILQLRRSEEAREQLGEQLRQAQKMEAIGRLAGGVAHDFNNLLSVIQLNAHLGLSELPPQDPSRLGFQEIAEATERAARLTRQLLAFGRRQVIAPRPLDLAGEVGGMRALLRRLIPENLELAFSLPPGLRPVLADRSQVEQVVVNLAVNARDAGARRIEIAVSEETAGPTAEQPAGPFGVLAVRDDGGGMAPGDLAQVFEPFFTTKGKGTGLGLSTVYGIARQHGGLVQVESAPGAGATFRVLLPCAEAVEGAAAPEAAPLPAPAGGGETVLLVEDEAAVRAATRAALARLGYRVLEASDGVEALALAARGEERIDVLVTDVVMPRMDGRTLASRLCALRPGLPVLFVSGYSTEVLAPHGALEPGLHLLRKPFDLADLARALRRVLGAGVAARQDGAAPSA